MVKESTTSSKLTRGDKAHKKLMDKLEIFKDGLLHSQDSFILVHKQSLDSFLEHTKEVSKSQEAERSDLYEIIKTSEDEMRRKEAYARLRELDRIRREEIEYHKESIKTESDKTDKNITGSIFCLAVAGGYITWKVLPTIGKNLLRTTK